MSRQIAFVEGECRVGGCACEAWAVWFQACEEADPKAIDEDRDPAELEHFAFDPMLCQRPAMCPLYAKARDAA
jgi:hypothetical protein